MTGSAAERHVHSDVFRQVMGTLASGVAVVTTVDTDGRPRGLTTTAVTSVSLDPPLLLVCVGSQSRTLPAIQRAGRFTVNLLDSTFPAVALHFASSLDDKFADIAWRAGANDCPVLHEHALAWAECHTEREVDAGDHVVFVGRVHDGNLAGTGRLPLTYFRGRYGGWSPSDTSHVAAVPPTSVHLESQRGDAR
ncbi:MAG: flavin reductase [Actinomycetia bacterium]|nr:flavin reductase [Actinomycetes bacterium]